MTQKKENKSDQLQKSAIIVHIWTSEHNLKRMHNGSVSLELTGNNEAYLSGKADGNTCFKHDLQSIGRKPEYTFRFYDLDQKAIVDMITTLKEESIRLEPEDSANYIWDLLKNGNIERHIPGAEKFEGRNGAEYSFIHVKEMLDGHKTPDNLLTLLEIAEKHASKNKNTDKEPSQSNQEKDTCDRIVSMDEYYKKKFQRNYERSYNLDAFGQRLSSEIKKPESFSDREFTHYLVHFRPKRHELISYTEVINYLEDIKKERPGEKIKIGHSNNRRYSGHTWMFVDAHLDDVDEAIAFVKQRRDQENANKQKQIAPLFAQFTRAINDYKKKGGKEEVVRVLEQLRANLNAEIKADRCYKKGEKPTFNGPDLNKTYYPIILKHFIQLTKKLAKHPGVLDAQEINDSKRALAQKLKEDDGYALALMSELPENNRELAINGKIYLSVDGDYLVRDPNGKVQRGTLGYEAYGTTINGTYYPRAKAEFFLRNLDNEVRKGPLGCDNVATILADPSFKNKVLAITAKAGHTRQEVSEKLRATLCAVFAALSGGLLGAVIGAVTMGGIGAIPTAIAGAAIGLAGGGAFGFFHARKENSNLAARRVAFDIYQDGERRLAKPQEQARETLEQIEALSFPGK